MRVSVFCHQESRYTCVVHTLGKVVNRMPVGKPIFPGMTAGSALAALRSILEDLGISDAKRYRTHDLRRGHAKDLQISGALCSCIHLSCIARVGRGSPVADINGWRMEVAGVS